MKTNKKNLSAKVVKLINDFDEACQNYSWQMDQGYNKTDINNAVAQYIETRLNLLKYILKLENKNKKV